MMRAATRKPAWYTRRGLVIPAAVLTHRLEMVRRKEARARVREAVMMQHEASAMDRMQEALDE